MTPEYLEQLADLADPDKLWRRSGLDRRDKMTETQRQQLDTGVALRRHASDLRTLIDAHAKGKSVLYTPLTPGGHGRAVRLIRVVLTGSEVVEIANEAHRAMPADADDQQELFAIVEELADRWGVAFNPDA